MSADMETSPAPLGTSIREKETPRLMIIKIVCENFKSYAGTKTLGPFHKCFTSIVGPNGSGKSNVIDSMLFVFGYRAAKIRSKKVSVLIHKSDKFRDLKQCSVSVHFQQIIDNEDPDGYSVVPDSNFVVSRTAFSDNSSHYHLNGKRVQFKEIGALLRQSGIDLDHNRFLILQGEVEQIALMKPKGQSESDEGMLEFLEDIIGSSRLKEPIEELSKRVDQLNEARGEKLNRVKVVEGERNELETAKLEAEEYLAMQKDIATKQRSLYQKYIAECKVIEAEASEKKSEYDEQIGSVKSELDDIKEQCKGRETALKKRIKDHERLVEEIEACKAAFQSCEQRDVKARQELKNGKASLKKVEKSLEKEKEKLEELEKVPERCAKEIEEKQNSLEILEVKKIKEDKLLSEVLASLRNATQGLQEEKEKYENELIGLNQTVNTAKSKLDIAQAELDLFRNKANATATQLKEAEQKLTETKETRTAREKEHKHLGEAIPVKRRELEKNQELLRSLNTTEAKLMGQVKTARRQLEEGRSSLEAFKTRGRVLQGLLQQRDKGEIPGIFGRLGDLGTIDDKYDVAISTACGALDNIVVDTMETAVKCVQFLKAGDIGSATFIGLDKMEHLRGAMGRRLAVPERVPRLFDLVKASDKKFETAFYYALRDTLVVDDLNQATRIALQGKTRHRVVTLGGQLIDQSGTMSGGGNRVVKGRMSSKMIAEVSPQQVQDLNNRLAENEKALKECGEHRLSVETKVNELSKELTEMEKEFKKCAVDANLLVEQEETIASRIAELREAVKLVRVDKSALKRLEETVAMFEKEYSSADRAASVVQDKAKKVHDEIMEVGGSRVKRQQEKVDAISIEMDQYSNAITKATVNIKTAERNADKTRKKIASQESEVATIKEKMTSCHKELVDLEQEAKTAAEQQEQLTAKAKEEEEELLKEKATIEGGSDQRMELESKLLDLKHAQEKYSAAVRDNQQKIKHFNSKIAKLQLKEEDVELSPEELSQLDKKSVEYAITVLEEKLKQMTPNMAAIEEYKRKEELYQQKMSDLVQITSDRDDARREFDDIRKQRLDEFMAGFSVITSKLKEMYQMITLGGDAELELVDSLDPFSEGIVFSVRPPKKSWKNISNLSGGEKTLSSLALVFALHHYKPSPLYVMDEIDAALDFRNVSIIAHYIKERTKNAQFVIISLRNNMFELADKLIGIYKTYDVTKSVAFNPSAFKATLAGQPLKDKNS